MTITTRKEKKIKKQKQWPKHSHESRFESDSGSGGQVPEPRRKNNKGNVESLRQAKYT